MLEERRVTTGHLLAALALIVIGVLIGWATDSGDAGDRGEQPGADVGPTRIVDGVPVGYERSREGAVAAALNYARVLARPEFVTDPKRRREVLAAIATPDVMRRYEQEDRIASLASVARLPVYWAARQGGPAVWQTTPFGYRVERYTNDEAHVFAWSVSIVGAGDVQPRASFGAGVTRLRWSRGDWRYAGDVGAQMEGPTPALLDDAESTSVREFRARLRGLQGLRYAP